MTNEEADQIAGTFQASNSRLTQAVVGYATLAGIYSPDGSAPVEAIRLTLKIDDAEWAAVVADIRELGLGWFDIDGARLTTDPVVILAKYATGGVGGRPSQSQWQRLRAEMHEESFEGATAYCMGCGADDQPLALDHVVPVSRGGSNHPMNFAWLCVPCNSSKGTKSWEEWRGSE